MPKNNELHILKETLDDGNIKVTINEDVLTDLLLEAIDKLINDALETEDAD